VAPLVLELLHRRSSPRFALWMRSMKGNPLLAYFFAI